MYAVIRTGGKQYRVSPGDVLKVEKLAGEANSAIEFSEVLSLSGAGKPVVKLTSAKVHGVVVEQGRGDKILVFHMKRKKQYKKRQGHRQAFTKVRIESVEVDGQSYGRDAKPENQLEK